MGKKRKPEDTGLEESDRMVFQNFSTAANSISQLYASSQTHQRLLFQAGEQHGLEKVHQWILARQGEGLWVTAADVVNYLQKEIDCGGEDGSVPLTSHPQQTPNTSTHMFIPPPTFPMLQGVVCPNTLCSPARGNLQPFCMAEGGHHSGNSPQESQIVDNQMLIGNSFPQPSAQQFHPAGEPNADSPDSVMDMHTEDHS